MMAEINQMVANFSSNFTDPDTNNVYYISGMNINMFYNEHEQVENPIGKVWIMQIGKLSMCPWVILISPLEPCIKLRRTMKY
jgi:hypothetical protein